MLEAYCGVAPIAATVAAAVPGAWIHAADIDPVALDHARRNLPASATIHRSDGLDDLPPELRGRFSLIAAVPPYVPASEAHLLPHDVLEREPERALLGGADGLDATRRLIDEAGDWLAPGGVLLSELHRTQHAAAAAHAERLGFRAGRRDGRDGQTVLLELRV